MRKWPRASSEGNDVPYVSKLQQRAMHAKASRGEISKKVVKEFDEATKKKPGGFKSLPEKKATVLNLLTKCASIIQKRKP